MDTSPEYIMQCEKAEEIQKLCKFESGDFYYEDQFAEVCNGGWIKAEKELFYGTWLPRQDQLQGMFADKNVESVVLILIFANFVREISWMPLIRSRSMEQLWLGFVMWEKYHKTWIGEEWEEAQ